MGSRKMNLDLGNLLSEKYASALACDGAHLLIIIFCGSVWVKILK